MSQANPPDGARRALRLRVVVLFSLLALAAALVLADRLGLTPLALSQAGRGREVGARTKPGKPFEGKTVDGQAFRLTLERVAKGLPQITDLAFLPNDPARALVLLKTGQARWLSMKDGKSAELFSVKVATDVEEGLLGLAFHPRFAENGQLYLNYVVREGGRDLTRIARYLVSDTKDITKAEVKLERVMLEVTQPYPNHNAGQLAFGPDGMLYIGMGDGGAANDPHGHGQNRRTLLGSMLRIDVNDAGGAGGGAGEGASDAKAYAIPKDNPYAKHAEFRAEIWAYGLRNPWRYSFDPKGRLIVADVGQNLWEEIDVVERGDNLGWGAKEGFVCTGKGDCEAEGMIDPIHVYGRDLGQSITGGHVYTGQALPFLREHYVFGDWASGRLFALRVPDDRKTRVSASSLGQWPIQPVAFAQSEDGELYVASFGTGEVYRLVAPKP